MTRPPRRDPSTSRPVHEAEGECKLPGEPLFIRIAAAVKLTGIGRSTLYELITAGELEVVKIGRSTFIKYASLKRLFERH